MFTMAEAGSKRSTTNNQSPSTLGIYIAFRQQKAPLARANTTLAGPRLSEQLEITFG
mgnify:FL=1